MEAGPLPISLPQVRLAPAEAAVAACHIPGSSLTASAICHIEPCLPGRQRLKLEEALLDGRPIGSRRGRIKGQSALFIDPWSGQKNLTIQTLQSQCSNLFVDSFLLKNNVLLDLPLGLIGRYQGIFQYLDHYRFAHSMANLDFCPLAICTWHGISRYLPTSNLHIIRNIAIFAHERFFAHYMKYRNVCLLLIAHYR